MSHSFKGKSLLTLRDFSAEEITYILNYAHKLKKKGKKGKGLRGKNIVLLFEKPSTRTRCAFEVAINDEGGCVTYLNDSHMGKKESIEDTAKTLSRYYDGIEFRGFEHKTIEALDAAATVPVWNGLTDTYHPTQLLADMMTLQEHVKKPLDKMKIVFVGDVRNNIFNSLMVGAGKMGFHLVGLGPQELWPEPSFCQAFQAMAKVSGGKIAFEESIAKAVKNADAIYTDVWFSMGEEEYIAERIELLKDYTVDDTMIRATANPHVIFMHCLPAFHDNETKMKRDIQEKFDIKDLEVSHSVFTGPHSVVFDQAENRMHTIKSVILLTIGD